VTLCLQECILSQAMAHRVLAFVATVAVIVAIVRVAFTYRDTSQGFDETCHVAAAIELLDRHTYKLDPIHPPLARLAIGIPLYLAGERFPHLSADEVAHPNYNVVGNHILYDDGHYLRNLVLARVAMLPFLALASGLVFLWARREYGESAGLFAVLLFTTTPMVMAFSSLAYTDLVTATTQFAALFAFTCWLETQNFRSTLLLGGAIGLALMSKLTSFLFLGAAGAAILASKWWLERNSNAGRPKVSVRRLTAALALSIVVLWSGYGFSVGHVREGMGVTSEQMPSFQHFPAPVGKLAKAMVQHDWVIPAPSFWRGLATIWVLNKTSPPAYLLGHIRPGGWWYFFLAGLAFKTPLPFLILCAVGVLALSTQLRARKWSGLAPVVAVAAILIVTMPVKYNAGTRHVLIVLPLLAMVGARGAAYLWQDVRRRNAARSLLILLLLWQVVETSRAQRDFISYFNEMAGRDPSRIMVAGCDLDCGQDLFRLARELRSRNITHFNLAVWSSADVDRMGLPQFEVLQPYRPVSGWVAISARSLRFGDVLHIAYPPDAFSWFKGYHPVAQVGGTIALYYIPAKASGQ
jgi:hypothetical protein